MGELDLFPDPRRQDKGIQVAIAINDINRALDNSDLYPFILTPRIREKIKFAHGWISDHAARGA